MQKRIRFHSEGNETKHSSFPHRAAKKKLPCVAAKLMPVHNLEVHREYLGKPREQTHCDKWAFVPFKSFKHNLQRRDRSYQNRLNETKLSSELIAHPASTSQITLKRYMNRKQRKSSKERQYYSHLVSPLQAWRKMHQQKDEHRAAEQKAFFLTEHQLQHMNRLNNFLKTGKNFDNLKSSNLSKTLKLHTQKQNSMDQPHVADVPLRKTSQFKLKGQYRKMQHAFGRWAEVEV